MQLPTASRTTRVRRLMAISAAAVAVMIAPTACDFGGYGGGASSHDTNDMNDTGDMGNMPGMDHGSPQHQEVIPVGNTVQSTPDPSADDAATTDQAAADNATDRRSRDGRRFRGRGQTSATIPPPTEPTSATATDAADPGASGSATATSSATASATATAPPSNQANNGLDVLGRDCSKSKLAPHDGFQKSPACVSTAMGEIAAEDKLPSLLITNSPRTVGVGQPFKLQISTRNLVRDRFLGAAAGGYYLESSFLNGAGLQRGHFHTACRMLATTRQAPDSGKAPEFFLATQDNGGGAAPDTVTIDVPGTATAKAGIMQCTSWAGDGSHRTPMMTKANETPAIDSVRILVSGSGKAEQENVSAADAQTDATQQAQAEQQQATAQKPDQDGATQGADTATATATETAVPAPAAAATTSADAPAGN
jgi:hypothetical protein